MRQWVKFYTEFLHDRKIRKLSEKNQLVFIKLVLLAGQEDKGGALPSVEDIALELYMKEKDVQKSVTDLVTAGMLSYSNDGYLYVTHFQGRQDTNLLPAEKQKRYRERRKLSNTALPERYQSVTETLPECNENVTLEKNRIDKNRIDIEENREDKNIYIDAVASSKPSKRRSRGELKPFGIAENVMLSDEEYSKLKEKLGTKLADEQIDELSLYMGKSEKNAKKYTNHYYAVLSWSKNNAEKPQTQQQFVFSTPKKKTYDFTDALNFNGDSGEIIDLC